MSDNLFKSACDEIRKAEKDLGHKMGWRFLYTAARTLSPATRIAFISLNPGGDQEIPDQGRESCEDGPAYLIESWKHPAGRSPLQLQVQALFAELALALNAGSGDLMMKSLMAPYIPFRSPKLSSLHRKSETQAFAFQLWSRLMRYLAPELIISIDHITFKDFHKILSANHKCVNSQKLPTGWGQVTATVNSYTRGNKRVVLARLPHLSRFKIFKRPGKEAEIEAIIHTVAKGLSTPH